MKRKAERRAGGYEMLSGSHGTELIYIRPSQVQTGRERETERKKRRRVVEGRRRKCNWKIDRQR